MREKRNPLMHQYSYFPDNNNMNTETSWCKYFSQQTPQLCIALLKIVFLIHAFHDKHSTTMHDIASSKYIHFTYLVFFFLVI